MAKVTPRFKSERPRHFVREWRKHRGYTQEQLAEMIGATHGAISQLENGKTAYTQQMLEALAEALACQPADLIMRDPSRADAPWTILDNLKPATRQKAVELLIMLRRADEAGEDVA